MTALRFIRTEVFRATQATMAAVAGVTQSTVSKWERGECEPSREELRRIRQVALDRGMKWRDEWFFQPPAHAPTDAPSSEVAA